MPKSVVSKTERVVRVHDQLHGSTQPVLSLLLEPGESIVAETARFAWMTDSIQMARGPAGLSAYTATVSAGTIAFASRAPGSIVCLELTPDRHYLVHCRGFLAATPGIEVATDFPQPLSAIDVAADKVMLLRIGGAGRAWVELSGDVVRRDLNPGTSLRTHPWHIGVCDASIAIQMAELPHGGNDTYHFAVLSGPGSVWLQSKPLLADPYRSSATRAARGVPAEEGPAGALHADFRGMRRSRD
jgi:uncharacterized protein (AIM24 family)